MSKSRTRIMGIAQFTSLSLLSPFSKSKDPSPQVRFATPLPDANGRYLTGEFMLGLPFFGHLRVIMSFLFLKPFASRSHSAVSLRSPTDLVGGGSPASKALKAVRLTPFFRLIFPPQKALRRIKVPSTAVPELRETIFHRDRLCAPHSFTLLGPLRPNMIVFG